MGPEDKKLAKGMQRNKKTSHCDDVERVEVVCGVRVALMSPGMSVRKGFLRQVALLPRRDEKDIVNQRMVPNYN